jgi:hypothetical protein
MSTLNGRLGKMEKLLERIPQPPAPAPRGNFSLAQLNLPAEVLRAMLGVLRQQGGAMSLADICAALPGGTVEMILAAVDKAKREADGQV